MATRNITDLAPTAVACMEATSVVGVAIHLDRCRNIYHKRKKLIVNNEDTDSNKKTRYFARKNLAKTTVFCSCCYTHSPLYMASSYRQQVWLR